LAYLLTRCNCRCPKMKIKINRKGKASGITNDRYELTVFDFRLTIAKNVKHVFNNRQS
jgi:hypothetical protein